MIRKLDRARDHLVILALASALGACSGSTRPPARSPTTDYGPPVPSTSLGQLVGADNVSPADKLATGPSIGSRGPRPAATPTTEKDTKGPRPAQSAAPSPPSR